VRTRSLALGALVAVLALTIAPARHAEQAAADTGVPSVTVSATTQVTDGQSVVVTVRSTQEVPVYRAEGRLCRAGVVYEGATSNRPSPDFESDGPNCPGPAHPVSTSSDSSVVDTNTYANAASADGETFLFRLGSGVVTWTDVLAGQPASLTCDETHPCALVVELLLSPSVGARAEWRPFVSTISYGNADPIAGCGGAAPGVVSTGGSDRMADAWINWTIGACAQPGAHGAPSRASFVGEGNAVQQLASGALDLAYTAGGYDEAMGLSPPLDPSAPNGGRRAVVAVPVAVNAAVLAVGGGVPLDATHKAPYKRIEFTSAELAAMLSGGTQGIAPHEGDIRDRNAELFQTGMYDTSAGFQIGATANAEASSWYLTKYAHDVASDAWKVPDTSTFGADRGRARGVDSALALADPTYAQSLTLLSGRPALRKGLIGPSTSSSGGIWVFTDLETATALSLTPVQIANAAGEFVAPSADSLRAALPSMKADSQGILFADPTVTAQQAGVTPYPTAFVEYALVAAEPLLDDNCAARAASQQLLTDWLAYITGAGQATLPTGLVPLTADLQAQAASRIALVGKAAVTGRCAGVAVVTPAPGTSGSSAPGSATGDFGDGATGTFPGTGSSSRDPARSATTPEGTPAASPAATGAANPELIAVPAFAGSSKNGLGGALLALLGIVGLTTLAARATTRAR